MRALRCCRLGGLEVVLMFSAAVLVIGQQAKIKGGDDMKSEFGRAAPEWFIKAEVYNGWYLDWSDEVVEVRLKGFPLIVGVPHSKEWIEKAHKHGVKVIPYVSFYQAMNISEAKKSGQRDPLGFLDSPFWMEVDLEKHPEWMLYGEDGKVRRPFDMPDYPAGSQQVCTNSPGYQESALRGVKVLMEMGADGLFIDNVHPSRDCFGPKFGKHKHIHPDKNNEQTYKELLQRVYKLVKTYGDEKLIMLNPGEVNPAYWRYGDAMMYESYICTHVSKERWHNWAKIRSMAESCKEALRYGKVVVALSYLGYTPFDVKDDAFYCYACAKLSGFHWADWFTLPKENPAQVLFKTRLGKPLNEMTEKEGVFFRIFENGLVVVNPLQEEKQLEIPCANHERLRDLYTGAGVEVKGNGISITIAGQSGRVYVR